jgi:CheY-like chemotaxis protein
MLRLLNDLLDLAKIEANQMSVNGEPADMRHTMRSCLRLMEPVAKAKRIHLNLDIDPDLPSRVVVDKMRLRQIVLNLLGNAVKFTEEGEVALGLEIIPSGDDRVIRITVRDTGIGIPADRLENVFEKFTQADATTARRFGGTGLGLPISAELARLMGGDLRVESELGKGSVFILDLPLRVAEPVAEEGEEFGSPDNGEASQSGNLRILVAEDNPVNQELTRAMVEKAGHTCELAENGREAIAKVRLAREKGAPFDLVLMDMQMPVLDGVGATMAIREAGFSPAELPIIAVTANAYTDDIRQCRVAGMQGHLAKPLRMGDLSRVIAQWSASPGEDDTRPAPSKPASAKPAAARRDAATSPRLRKMFADRLTATRDAIAAAQAMGSIDRDTRDDIAGLLHQIAGTAAYFDGAELGSRCLETEKALLACEDDGEMRAMLTRIDRLLGQESPEETIEDE